MELKHVIVDIEDEISSLLIVPYGIETGDRNRRTPKGASFNRTLWN